MVDLIRVRYEEPSKLRTEKEIREKLGNLLRMREDQENLQGFPFYYTNSAGTTDILKNRAVVTALRWVLKEQDDL